MSSSNKRRIELINMLCRICAREDSNSIPIFGDVGRKQNLIGKIQTCLPITIHENDFFPKQICLACLTKLDSVWDMHVLCKEAQVKIERKFYALRSHENLDHNRSHVGPAIKEQLSKLSETSPISYGSAVIFLTRERVPTPPPSAPPSTVTREAQEESVIAPIAYVAPAPATAAIPTPTTSAEDIFPQALIQVAEPSTEQQPAVYHPAVPVASPTAAPATAPAATPRRRDRSLATVPQPMASPAPAPTPAKRQKVDTPKDSNDKKLCSLCNKYFPDDVIDHHVGLHYRQSFRTCVECGKNFRSEDAMERHRCGDKKDNETIDLDADDDDLVIL